MELTLTQKTLCALVAENLFGCRSNYDPDTNWRAVFKESRMQAVALLAFQNFNQLPLEAELAEKIEAKLSTISLKNLGVFQNHGYLHEHMEQNHIPYCILKGVSSARYYPSPLLRTMGDVDFLVDPADSKRCAEVLLKDGFSAEKLEQGHHCVYKKTGRHFELHYEPPGIPNGKAGELIRLYLDDVISSAETVMDEFVEYRCPSAFHHGLIMLLHMQHHLLSEGIGLRHLCDWAVFADSHSEEFQQLFCEKLKRVGLWRFAQTVSLAAAMYLGLKRQPWMGENEAQADALVEEVFTSGNFGHKEPSRSYEGMFISNRGKDGVGKNRLQQLFHSMNKIVAYFWPAAKRIQILYPIGWVYFGIRFVVRTLLGKHKDFNLFKVYKNSGERKRFYAELHLFEEE